jgi:hypothetical protein
MHLLSPAARQASHKVAKIKSAACCGEKGNISPECPDQKTTPLKEEWCVRKTQPHAQTEQQQEEGQAGDNELTTDTSVTSNRPSRVAWSGLLIGRTVEKESHHNDDQEMGSRLKS